jgi:hypothetical protein
MLWGIEFLSLRTGRDCDPRYVDPEDWSDYEGDHWPVGDQCDGRLLNLRPRAKVSHRGTDRVDWPSSTLPDSQRGLKRPRATLLALREKAARAKAAKSEAKAKAKAKANTRRWR